MRRNVSVKSVVTLFPTGIYRHLYFRGGIYFELKRVIQRLDELKKQEDDFVAYLVAGLTQRQAYRKAFKQSKNWKDKTVDNKASELFNLREIQGRYRELLKEARNASSNMALWSREQAFSEYEWLKDKAKHTIIEEGLRKASSDSFIQALDGMNKMTFNDPYLGDEKIKLEIEQLKSQLTEEDITQSIGFTFNRGEADAERSNLD